MIRDILIKEQSNELEEGLGQLQGLPVPWIRLLTKDYGFAGENSEVVKLGQFKVGAESTRANALAKLLNASAKQVKDAGEDAAGIVGFFLKAKVPAEVGKPHRPEGEPVALIRFSNSYDDRGQYEMVTAEGEAITRVEKEYRSRYGRSRDVKRKDLTLSQLSALLPTDTDLELYVVYEDINRKEKRAKRTAAKDYSPTGDIEQITKEASKIFIDKSVSELESKLPQVFKKLERRLHRIPKMLSVISSEEKGWEDVNKYESNIISLSNALQRLKNLADTVRDAKGLKSIATKDSYRDEAGQRELHQYFKRLRNAIYELDNIFEGDAD